MTDITETAKRVLALSEQATPGPWATETGSRFRGAINATVAGASRQVAMVTGEAVQFEPPGIDPARRAADNAGFIAATRADAPNLAAYVLAVAPLVERLRHHATAEGTSQLDMLGAVSNLLAADAAARGAK